jgi:hypothetical protein
MLIESHQVAISLKTLLSGYLLHDHGTWSIEIHDALARKRRNIKNPPFNIGGKGFQFAKRESPSLT